VSENAPSVAPPIVQTPIAGGVAHLQLRIFQVFVNVEGLKIPGRRILGLITLPTRKRYGFYAVMLVAAGEESKPPLLLSLAKDALVEEFSPLSRIPPEAWHMQMVDWRMVGAAPPMFQDPGCIDSGWGAAWYDMADGAAKQHRYRLAKARLWKGRRAKAVRVPKEAAGKVAAKEQPVSAELRHEQHDGASNK